MAGQSFATAGMQRCSIEGSLCNGNPYGNTVQHDTSGKEIYAVAVSLFTEEDSDDDDDFSSARKKTLTQENHLGFTDNLFRSTAAVQPVPHAPFCKNPLYTFIDIYIMQGVFRI